METQELCVEGGWVHQSWHIRVVCHSYGWFGGGRDGVAVGKYARQGQEGLIACREMPEHFLSAKCVSPKAFTSTTTIKKCHCKTS